MKILLLFGFSALLACATTRRNSPPCALDPLRWREDVCGANGYRSRLGDCLFENSKQKPVFKQEQEVLRLLGQPDTTFVFEGKKELIYVTSGNYFLHGCYNDGMLKSLNVWVDTKGKVTSVTGAIY